MKAKYIGDVNDPTNVVPDTFEAYGLTFAKGKSVEIPAELEAKFIGNSHFDTSGAPESEEGKAAAE